MNIVPVWNHFHAQLKQLDLANLDLGSKKDTKDTGPSYFKKSEPVYNFSAIS